MNRMNIQIKGKLVKKMKMILRKEVDGLITLQESQTCQAEKIALNPR